MTSVLFAIVIVLLVEARASAWRSWWRDRRRHQAERAYVAAIGHRPAGAAEMIVARAMASGRRAHEVP